MLISEFRDQLSDRLASFVSSQWAQMGLSQPRGLTEYRPVDPEALLLLSFEVGRDEPRLFEELGDWIIKNQSLVSFRRLKTLTVSKEDRHLVSSVLDWAAHNGLRGQRPSSAPPEIDDKRELLPFFRNQTTPVREPDESFLRQGFLKPTAIPSGKSREPEFLAAINLAFRLRLLLGTGVRSEMIRVLLGRESTPMSVKELSNQTAYSKRNVQESINDLRSAGFIQEIPGLSSPTFGISAGEWFEFLGPQSTEIAEALPWPQLSFTYRTLLRWAWTVSALDLSDYMLASEAGQVSAWALAPFRSTHQISSIGNPGSPDYWENFTGFFLGTIDRMSKPSPPYFESQSLWKRAF